MPKIKHHFKSFESFVKLLYSLRTRIKTSYYRYFGMLIDSHLTKTVENYLSNTLFSNRIEHFVTLPSNLFELISNNEALQIQLEANRSLHDMYNMLGSGNINISPIDWHTDFKAKYRWSPGLFYKDYKQEGIETNSDVKVPRELSRCHHFLKLGIAYRLTKNEEYARKCILQMENWIQENPLMHSINWGCTMDVAIRAVNWIWAIRLISDSPSLDKKSITSIKISLYEHGWFIYRNPEKSAFNNHNHYLADLAGQIHLGLIFNDLPESKKWLEVGTRELFREMRMQILPSGMSYERSTNYNRLVLELLIVPILLLRQNNYEIPSDIWYRLEQMFEFIMYSLKPDGNTPVIGDQDDGRLLPFGCEANIDYRYLLSLGSILYNRSDFKKNGDGYNIYCILFGGLNSKEKYNNLPEPKVELHSRAFPDAGFYIMRKDDNYLLFNGSGKSHYPELPAGTHTHSDLMSFELFTLGKSFLIDPGSYIYTGDSQQRMLFRGTAMHNTVTIDGKSQNVIRKEVLWDFERNAIPEILEWASNETSDKVVAQHTGFLRLKQPVMHKRTICFDKLNLQWDIKDELTGVGNHLFEWYFHFDKGIDFIINGMQIKTICSDGKNIQITFNGIDDIQLTKKKSFVSIAYGIKEESLILVVSSKKECPQELNTVILPSS